MMCLKWRGEMASTTWLLLLVLGFLSGCATQKMSGDQLARVAKDWSLSIRASQIIPVYPLTEDLQPGDVFLVPTRAAFPTYNSSVSRSGGLNVAIPVQSVPHLLDSASANGTIALKDVFTHALRARTMFDAIHQWCRDNADYLKQFTPPESSTSEGVSPSRLYLKVINRVYLVKAVDVSLFSNRGFGLGGSAGVPQPVHLLNVANATEVAKQFAAINEILSSAVTPAKEGDNAGGSESASESSAPQLPVVGGTVKLAMATSRSVSLIETFHRPLVIDYLASDCAIGPGVACAAPVPAFQL